MHKETTVLALGGNHPFLSRALAAFARIAAATCARKPPRVLTGAAALAGRRYVRSQAATAPLRVLARVAALAGRRYVCSQAAIAPLRKLVRAAAFAGQWPPRALARRSYVRLQAATALAHAAASPPRRPVCSPAVGVLARAASCEVSGRRERSPAGAACDRWLHRARAGLPLP